MAKETITRLIDDLTGKPIEEGGESIAFSVNGKNYEIDLEDKAAAKFHAALKTYVEAATEVFPEEPEMTVTPVRQTRRRSSAPSNKRDPEELAAMRTWLRANGHEVADRGRIKQELQDLYEAR